MTNCQAVKLNEHLFDYSSWMKCQRALKTPFPDELIQTNGCCFTNIQCLPWLKRICSQTPASDLAVFTFQPTLLCFLSLRRILTIPILVIGY